VCGEWNLDARCKWEEGYLVDPSSSDADEKLRSTPEKVPAKDTELAKYLRQQGIAKVVVTGLATDYWYVGSSYATSIDIKFPAWGPLAPLSRNSPIVLFTPSSLIPLIALSTTTVSNPASSAACAVAPTLGI
jgi:hypothetical protein